MTKSTADFKTAFQDLGYIDLELEAETAIAKSLIDEVLILIGPEKFDIMAEYMIVQIAHKIITDKDSPMLCAFNEALSGIYDDFTAYQADNQQNVMELKLELNTSKMKNVALSASVSSLEGALASLRKRLKCEETKTALGQAQKLFKKPALTDVEKLVVSLATCVKDACVSIKGA